MSTLKLTYRTRMEPDEPGAGAKALEAETSQQDGHNNIVTISRLVVMAL